MNERTLACALNRLLAWALRPVAVQNGNKLGRLRPSSPIGSFARAMTPSVSRSACPSRHLPHWHDLALVALDQGADVAAPHQQGCADLVRVDRSIVNASRTLLMSA